MVPDAIDIVEHKSHLFEMSSSSDPSYVGVVNVEAVAFVKLAQMKTVHSQ